MPDYKETTVSGTQWQRCNGVVIANPYNAQPTVRLTEEIVAVVGGNTFVQSAQGLSFDFDPSEVIPLLDPQTGLATGSTTTGGDVYVALYSLYIKRATERDAAAAV